MPKKEHSCSICPTVELISLISKKWTLFIIHTMHEGACCYSEIERKLSDINPGILSTRLKELADAGFIEKEIISKQPTKIQYVLTQKGASFAQEFKHIISWSEKWMQ